MPFSPEKRKEYDRARNLAGKLINDMGWKIRRCQHCETVTIQEETPDKDFKCLKCEALTE